MPHTKLNRVASCIYVEETQTDTILSNLESQTLFEGGALKVTKFEIVLWLFGCFEDAFFDQFVLDPLQKSGKYPLEM